MSTLGFAILGLLAREPMTGYDLARRMQAPIGYMWTAKHTQIYGELATLEDERLVRHRVIAGPGPRDTKRYMITARGRRELTAWVDSPLGPQPARSELMLRVRCFWIVAPERCRAFVESVRLDHEHRLSVYLSELDELRALGERMNDPSDWAFGNHATLQAGIRSERALIDWATWLLASLPHTGTPAAGPELDGRSPKTQA